MLVGRQPPRALADGALDGVPHLFRVAGENAWNVFMNNKHEDGKIVTAQSAATDTVVASARAYVAALNKLMVRRLKTAPAAASA